MGRVCTNVKHRKPGWKCQPGDGKRGRPNLCGDGEGTETTRTTAVSSVSTDRFLLRPKSAVKGRARFYSCRLWLATCACQVAERWTFETGVFHLSWVIENHTHTFWVGLCTCFVMFFHMNKRNSKKSPVTPFKKLNLAHLCSKLNLNTVS